MTNKMLQRACKSRLKMLGGEMTHSSDVKASFLSEEEEEDKSGNGLAE